MIESLAEDFKKNRIESVIHLASEFIAHHKTANEAISLIEANIVFGGAILEACRLGGVKKLITAGSAWQHYEGNSYFPVSLYAATKESFEALARHYVESENLKICRLHFFDSFGSADPRNKLIPVLKKHFDSCLFAIKNKSSLPPPLELGSPDHLIDLLDIRDSAQAIRMAMESEQIWAEKFPLYAIRSSEVLRLSELLHLINGWYRNITGTDLPLAPGKRPSRPREMLRPWNFAPTLPCWAPSKTVTERLQELFLGNSE
jgi:nucleoside-diphosphate-sugar epimerase